MEKQEDRQKGFDITRDFLKADGKLGGIYRITCTATGKFYLGRTYWFAKRFNEHLGNLRRGKNTPLGAAYKKYGPGAFLFSVQEIVPDKSDMMAREQYYLDHFTPWKRTVGFNQSKLARGTMGVSCSEEKKAKLRAAWEAKFTDPVFVERCFQQGKSQSHWLITGSNPKQLAGLQSEKTSAKLRITNKESWTPERRHACSEYMKKVREEERRTRGLKRCPK